MKRVRITNYGLMAIWIAGVIFGLKFSTFMTTIVLSTWIFSGICVVFSIGIICGYMQINDDIEAGRKENRILRSIKRKNEKKEND